MLTLLLFAFPAAAEDSERVLVTDPYLEMRTGPGRGYPVFYVAERDEWVEILKRHTDWFKVRTARGKEGWVDRAQMENTLTDAGVKKTFRDVLLDDFLLRRAEFGFSFGRFQRDPIMTAYGGYRLHENFLVELSIGESSGNFSSTSLMYAALVSQPYPEQRWSPFFALGAGRFKNTPKATLIGAHDVTADMANMAVGLRYYVTRQFFVSAQFRDHVTLIDHDNTNTYREYSLGLSFFF